MENEEKEELQKLRNYIVELTGIIDILLETGNISELKNKVHKFIEEYNKLSEKYKE